MGLARRPEEPDAFVASRAEGADIYVARDIWEQLTNGAGRLHVLMPGHGMACFRFEDWTEESTL